jgi:hypothetical protein
MATVLGYFHSVRERKSAPTSNKRLRHAIATLDSALALVSDVVSSPKLKPEELSETEQIIRRSFEVFRDEINQVLLRFLAPVEKGMDQLLEQRSDEKEERENEQKRKRKKERERRPFLCNFSVLLTCLSVEEEPGTEVLVRRSPQVGGKAKRIAKPNSYADLLRDGGAALGIKAVRKRREEKRSEEKRKETERERK